MTRAQLEDLIARANSGGYRIHNLFQYQTGQWQAHLRRDVGRVACFSYAKGATPAAALAGAIRHGGLGEEETTAEAAAAAGGVGELLGWSRNGARSSGSRECTRAVTQGGSG